MLTATEHSDAQLAAWRAKVVAPPGASLAAVMPDLAARARSVVKYPDLSPGQLHPKSNLIVVWEFQCGATFRLSVSNATKARFVGCRRCQNRGKSLLEFEVAVILEAQLGLPVETHKTVTSGELDIFVPSLAVAFELDPFSSHSRRLATDTRQLERHHRAGWSVSRVREDPLPSVGKSFCIPRGAASFEWASRIAASLGAGTPLTNEELASALKRAGQQWERTLRSPPPEPLSGHPLLLAEFLANVSHPGRSPEWTSQHSPDTITWRCSACRHEWAASAYHRASRSRPTGCPKCASRSRANKAAAAPIGRRAVDVAPELVAEFVANLTRGGPLDAAYAGSADVCLWRCCECGREWTARIQHRVRHGHRGCRSCNLAQAWTTEARRSTTAWWSKAHAFKDCEERALSTQLTSWANRQRRSRSELTPTQREFLETVPGWSWDAHAARRWDLGFRHLQFYVEQTGAAAPTYRFTAADGYRLGAWVVAQRGRRDTLSAQQVRQLEALPGWEWTMSKGRRARTSPSR